MSVKKILLIDEQTSEIEAACDVLTEKYGVDSWKHVESSKIGLEILEKEHRDICCISLDLLMPFITLSKEEKKKYNLEGLYVLKVIKDKFPDIPIVCYSFVREEFATDFIAKYNATYIYKGEGNSYYELLNFFDRYMRK